ncbi:MAG: HAMP domain-containing histidine kinase [Chitinophagaceae bacterium]|nr:HAMP domain-containing histidine kinase [Chitinophagaceae bacterium]
MKKVFPLIIALIALSLLGLIYLQVEWIRGAMKLKREQYDNDIYSSLNNIKDSINNKKNKDVLGFIFQSPVLSFSNYIPTSRVISNYQLKEIIKYELKKKHIKQTFEFCIANEARLPIMFSTGYKTEFMEANNNYQTFLNGENIINNEVLNVYMLEPENYFQNHLASLLIFAALFTSIIIAAFMLTIKALLSQKKLSEIKSDFINNMTHEFKTPIATIQLATDAMNNEKVINNIDQIKYYSGIIKEENRRMNKQVEKILQASQLEKDEIKLTMKKLNIHEMIERVASHSQLQIEEIGAKFTIHLEAENPFIMADEVHFTNIIYNLVDNAIKYSKENPEITISTKNASGNILISVKDNGIGMDKDTQNNVYEKFFRAHTGNLHNVKGFGLGLTYVKNIVDSHKAKITLESELGQGSKFTVVIKSV